MLCLRLDQFPQFCNQLTFFAGLSKEKKFDQFIQLGSVRLGLSFNECIILIYLQ
jgi:hypothetical protein